MTFREGCLKIHTWMQVFKWISWYFLSQLVLQKMKEDNFSQIDDYDAPFYERQYIRKSCHISFFKFNSFYQFSPPHCLKF